MYIMNGLEVDQPLNPVNLSESESIFDQIRNALVRGQWYLALMLSTLLGERDENKLTNLIFFARHPERKSRRLERSEANFLELSNEWLDIRKNLVRPYLSRLQSGAQTGQIPRITQPATANLDNLRRFASPLTEASVNNALSIMKIICAYNNIPWRLGFTILEHEGGVRKFNHSDGVMQTTRTARKSSIKLIPRPLKLAVLGLPVNDSTSESDLTSRLHNEFHRRLTVQIAAGVQELKKALDRFNGYIALAYQAYNAGSAWAFFTATNGEKKSRPKGITTAEWEKMCLEGATLLHRKPDQIQIGEGVWQCDANIPTWFKHIPVFDRKTGRQLIAYKYLRKFTGQIRKNHPNITCNWKNHKTRQQGSGPILIRSSRNGSLDKLYNPSKMSRLYYQAVQTELGPLEDDGMPLKVENGQLVKKVAANI